MKKPAPLLIVAAVLILSLSLIGCIIGLPMAALLLTPAAAAVDCGDTPVRVPPQQDWRQWNGQQIANAGQIVTAGQNMGIAPRGFVIALATAMQESSLKVMANDNPAYPEVKRISLSLPHEGVGHDHDSVGLFQQRPLEGDGAWGTVQELMTPSISARKFYTALLQVEGWQQMRLTDAAQAVQKSGTPNAYQKHQAAAEALAAHLLGLPDIDLIGGGAPTAPCGPDQFGPVPVGPNGWVQPLDKTFPVVAPFGQDRGDHRHAGVDIGGNDVRGKPIRAAADGIVETVRCNAGSDNCDVDGYPGLGGCGWYADVRHAGNVVTRYCHMLERPYVTAGQRVTAGQTIGLVGSSGNSSGPHLHFEVHLRVPPGAGHLSYRNAVDPVAFMAAQQAPIPQN